MDASPGTCVAQELIFLYVTLCMFLYVFCFFPSVSLRVHFWLHRAKMNICLRLWRTSLFYCFFQVFNFSNLFLRHSPGCPENHCVTQTGLGLAAVPRLSLTDAKMIGVCRLTLSLLLRFLFLCPSRVLPSFPGMLFIVARKCAQFA